MNSPVKLNGGWRFLDHTADMRVEVRGASLESLFINAARSLLSLFNLQADPGTKEQIEVSVEGGETDELIVDWLRELLYHCQTKRLAITDIDILHISENCLKAMLIGSRVQEIYESPMEIKGVTYHGSSVQQDHQGYVAKIIFDI